MERTLTPEERIRRAEEIYNNRKRMQPSERGVRVTSKSVNAGTKPNLSLLKKMILQILICLVIYFIFYLIQNTDYLFSEDVIGKTQDVLSYDVNFGNLYEKVTQYIDTIIPKEIEEKQDKEEKKEEPQNEDKNTENANPATQENIGGAAQGEEANNEEKAEQQDNTNANLSQMELDANAIKEKYTILNPLKVGYTISSRYGLRNPTTPTVPKNHTGIDLAVPTGTVIYAALDGVVKIASSEGDYGNHLRIEKEDVAIYYAHCSKLYVKEGDQIKQGDAIAEVGATGNVTGPHLHFEFRKQDRYVNPELVMNF